jgi:hypothetical protein
MAMHDYYVTADNDIVLTLQLDDDAATEYPDHANVSPVEPVDPPSPPEDES